MIPTNLFLTQVRKLTVMKAKGPDYIIEKQAWD